jgi:hypothetical protein
VDLPDDGLTGSRVPVVLWVLVVRRRLLVVVVVRVFVVRRRLLVVVVVRVVWLLRVAARRGLHPGVAVVCRWFSVCGAAVGRVVCRRVVMLLRLVVA